MSVKVVARSLGGDGVPGVGDALDQDFALVVSNAQEQASSPVLVQGGVTVDDTQNGQNGDGALEPGESFDLQQGVRNTGTDVATGVTASLSGASGLNIEQADSAYDDITADTEEENSTPYEATLSGATSCGVDATGILDVTSAEGGTQPVPVTIPTGRPGPPTTHTKTQTLAIPDDNAGGAQSTLFVPVSGRIKDLDVAHQQHRPQLRRRPEGGADQPRQLHDRASDRARRRAEQRRQRSDRHRFRRRGVDDDRVGDERGAVHRPASSRRATSSRASTARSSRAPGSCA